MSDQKNVQDQSELSEEELNKVSGGNAPIVAGPVIGTKIGGGTDDENASRSDLGQQLQLALQEANNIYTRK